MHCFSKMLCIAQEKVGNFLSNPRKRATLVALLFVFDCVWIMLCMYMILLVKFKAF